MDAGQFDDFARAVANRRSLLGRLGAGGLSALLVLLIPSRTQARTPVTCEYDLTLGVRVGPSRRTALVDGADDDGKLAAHLTITIGDGGSMDGSRLTLDDDSELPIVGEAAGHRVGARVLLEDDHYFVLQGVGDQRIDSCKGRIDGSLTGPLDGDLGDWHAIARRQRPTPTPTAAAPAEPPAPAATEPPRECPPVDCGPEQSVDPVSCECVCPSDQVACGIACCSAGTVCLDPAQEYCVCADGTVCCYVNETCIPACPEGQVMDDACNCVAPEPTPTVNPCPPGQGLCGEGIAACIDLMSDPRNCGVCDGLCFPDQICSGGACVCAPGTTSCTGGGQLGGITACVDTTTNREHCGACGNACAQGQNCISSVCQ